MKTSNGDIVNCTIDYISKINKRMLLLHLEEETCKVDFLYGKIEVGDKKGQNLYFDTFSEDKDISYFEMHKSILEGKTEDVCNINQALLILKICLKGENNV